MKIALAKTLLLSSILPTSLAEMVKNLRGGGGGRKLQGSSSCTVLMRADLSINPSRGLTDEGIECEMNAEDMDGYSGLSFPIQGNDAQMTRLKTLLESGDHASGESVLTGLKDAWIDKGKLFLPPGLEIALEKVSSRNNKRNLAIVTGKKPILVVKVTDINGLARTESAAQIGDDVFGTNGDPVNLKSQLFGCSMEKLDVTEGDQEDTSLTNGVPNGQGVAPGVMEVTIQLSLQSEGRGTVRNAVTTAVQNAIGESLPGRYQQVMYVLQGCYVECGWAAYAYINSWNSVYQGVYYKHTGVQVHELGHNFNLAHSGGLDGQTYTDHTCMMGNPLYSDDTGKMCYNPAKNWQIGWYSDRTLLLDPQVEPTKTVTLVGIADYLNEQSTDPVVIKVETRLANDFFVGFNRATGVNAQNDEGDDVVTVIQVDGNNGSGYSQSRLRAKLGFTGDITGSSYTISNFGGTGVSLTISVDSINLGTVPATATVNFQYGSPGTPSPTSSPTISPTKAPTQSPTKAPTQAPTESRTKSPTKSPSPTDSPTKSPTKAPTQAPTQSPTQTPTQSPTKSPTQSPTSSPTKAPTVGPNCPSISWSKTCRQTSGCFWEGGLCKNQNTGPTAPTPTAPTPTAPTPTAPTPTTGSCSINSCSSCEGGGACKDAGCRWSKGNCVP